MYTMSKQGFVCGADGCGLVSAADTNADCLKETCAYGCKITILDEQTTSGACAPDKDGLYTNKADCEQGLCRFSTTEGKLVAVTVEAAVSRLNTLLGASAEAGVRPLSAGVFLHQFNSAALTIGAVNPPPTNLAYLNRSPETDMWLTPHANPNWYGTSAHGSTAWRQPPPPAPFTPCPYLATPLRSYTLWSKATLGDSPSPLASFLRKDSNNLPLPGFFILDPDAPVVASTANNKPTGVDIGKTMPHKSPSSSRCLASPADTCSEACPAACTIPFYPMVKCGYAQPIPDVDWTTLCPTTNGVSPTVNMADYKTSRDAFLQKPLVEHDTAQALYNEWILSDISIASCSYMYHGGAPSIMGADGNASIFWWTNRIHAPILALGVVRSWDKDGTLDPYLRDHIIPILVIWWITINQARLPGEPHAGFGAARGQLIPFLVMDSTQSVDHVFKNVGDDDLAKELFTGIFKPREDGLLMGFQPSRTDQNSVWINEMLQTNKYAADDLLDIQNACSTYKGSGTDPNWLMSGIKALLESIPT